MAEFMKGVNPDILSCLANLSSDEVFTSPELANKMLDLLPQELFHDPETKFLDPACKSGVFLREITKRLIEGLEDFYPDLQERVDHVLHNQVYGIAITELTGYISRRSLYCSKYPNGEKSVSKSGNADGNIIYRCTQHTWKDNKCVFCGANRRQYEREEALETHAYEFIHSDKPEDIFNMKFDVIISNPPYHLNTGATQAIPIYPKFVEAAKKLDPRYIVMIIPSRWYAGGMNLDSFRDSMLSDSRIRELVDYPNAKDCFPGVSIGGGICYFLWDKEYQGKKCRYTCNYNDKTSIENRNLNEFPTFIRYNEAISVIRKVKESATSYLSDITTSLSPFGLDSSVRGNRKKQQVDDCTVYSSDGVGYISKSEIRQGLELIDKYKILVGKLTSEHANESDRQGQFRVLSTLKLLNPGEVCTFSYFIIGGYKKEEKEKAVNLLQYLKTKFVRFLLLQSVSSINLSKEKFQYVPMQDFSESWTDEKLYRKYNLEESEITFIEDMIKPMD